MDAREALKAVLASIDAELKDRSKSEGEYQSGVRGGLLVSRAIIEAALLKGLTEAGERRVMANPTHGRLHWEVVERGQGDHWLCCYEGTPCLDFTNTHEAAEWVARQRKDSHAG